MLGVGGVVHNGAPVKQVQANAPPLANRRGHGANEAKFKVELVQSMTINLGSTTAQVRKADHCQWR